MKKLITPICFLLGGLLLGTNGQAQFNYKKKAAPATTNNAKDSVAPVPVQAPVVSKTTSVPDPNIKPKIYLKGTFAKNIIERPVIIIKIRLFVFFV